MTPPDNSSSSSSGRGLPYVLHLSGDFPDVFEGFKTKVIKTLVDLTRDVFEHRVISLNRVNPSGWQLASIRPGAPIQIDERSFEDGLAISYAAPGRGVFHRTMLAKLADWLVAQILAEGRRPDLIVGHKLTIEGVVARLAAERLQVPYAISIQGDTDTKIMAVRRDLHGEFGKVLSDAAMVFPFAPWSLEEVLVKLRIASVPHRMLPCPTDIDAPLKPMKGSTGLVSVFHLKNYKRKNFAQLIDAMRLLEQEGGEVPDLTVIGGGAPREVAACEALIAGSPRVTLAGAMDREQVRQKLNQATAFVMPSLRETFGLVFVEALFAGTPIIYPAGTAVDGYFDGHRFAIAVDARDPRSIAEAMARAWRDEAALKDELAAWQQSEHARQFMRPAIAATFADGLRQALAGSRLSSQALSG